MDDIETKEEKFEIDYDKLAELVAQKLNPTEPTLTGEEKPADAMAEMLKTMTAQFEESKKVNGALLKMIEANGTSKATDEFNEEALLSLGRYGGVKNG